MTTPPVDALNLPERLFVLLHDPRFDVKIDERTIEEVVLMAILWELFFQGYLTGDQEQVTAANPHPAGNEYLRVCQYATDQLPLSVWTYVNEMKLAMRAANTGVGHILQQTGYITDSTTGLLLFFGEYRVSLQPAGVAYVQQYKPLMLAALRDTDTVEDCARLWERDPRFLASLVMLQHDGFIERLLGNAYYQQYPLEIVKLMAEVFNTVSQSQGYPRYQRPEQHEGLPPGFRARQSEPSSASADRYSNPDLATLAFWSEDDHTWW